MNKEWAEMNKTLQLQIKKKDTFAMGIDTLLELRRTLMELIMQFKNELSDIDFCAMPYINAKGYHSKTIAYSLWHIFRIEDIVAHSLIANDEQILFVGDYQSRIKSPIITTAKALLLQPTEDMKIVNHKIKNSIIITVEHLLSYEFWEKIKGNDWVEEKNRTEILNMFENVMDIRKSLDSVIDELINNKDMKETIIYLMPKDDKKDKILKLVQSEVENGNVSVIEGFSNTILELEKQFS